jgi:hypothetical protein
MIGHNKSKYPQVNPFNHKKIHIDFSICSEVLSVIVPISRN